MLGWFRRLLPREERFFDLFARHSQAVVQGAEEVLRERGYDTELVALEWRVSEGDYRRTGS